MSVGESAAAVRSPRTVQAPAPGAPGPLRLTRRGRIVVRLGLALLVVLAVAAIVLAVSRPAFAGGRSAPMQVRYHVVLPGETLLQIAAEVDPRVDPRDTATRIVELNALRGSGVQAGQRIALPATS